jgi:LPXTG-motif cell wall-anchored protein
MPSSAGGRGNGGGKANGNRYDKGNRYNKPDRVKRQRHQRVKGSNGPPLFLAQYIVGVSDKNKNGRLDADDTVRFGFKVTNSGSLSATDLQIVDRRLNRFKVKITCERTELAPGETTTCTSGPMRITKYQAKNNLGRNFAYASAIAGGEAIRSNSTVITLVKSISELRRLPNTGASVGTLGLGAAGALLVSGVGLVLLGHRRRRSDPQA